MICNHRLLFLLAILPVACAPHQDPPPAAPPATRASAGAATAPGADAKVMTLFDGKTMKNWKTTEFGGEGPAEVEEGQIIVHSGSTLSGVNWTGPALPKENYEIELDAMKLDGSDFFVGLTFPYKNDYASLVLGGWGGSVVGISSVNGNDAANNEWSAAREFKKKTWYHVRLRATGERISAWLDNDTEPFLDIETTGKEISTRSDIDAAKPLGLSTYQTSAAYKNIILRKL
ncbi:MAG: hypothetical protein JWN40_801 [Phycisphaerales bacterium]|nr:hypothetical protein [Phycisphaerales bacterium]